MTGVLVFLLVMAIAALGILGYYTITLHVKAKHLAADLAGQQERYDNNNQQWNDAAAATTERYQAVVNKHNEDVTKWNEFAKAAKAEIQRLSKWRGVADADAKAAEILRDAGATLEKAKADATNLVAVAQQQGANLQAGAHEKAIAELASAKEKAKALKDEAQAILNSATTQAARLTEAANKKGEEIAGSAYDALKNVSLYERTVKSMKNIIEGYGDQYIIPPHSLLDDLGEDFSHVQAGWELKRARECTRVMIQNHTAGACDYVEANRRDSAINFVVDAFNGKVDSILSRVKHDNAGKLEQEIRDAFTLVTFNGKGFRDARITEGYLAARLDELKWAAITHQLALQEREEQQCAKEQAREEARAEKERARALHEAAKERETMRRAMEQAQEQFEHAAGEQKAMYEARLREMVERLKQVEEREQRAISMAQQTKRGHVYIISNIGSFGDDVYKIGLTRRFDPRDRIDELGGASVPFGFDVHATILSDDAPALELKLHKHFLLRQMNKVNHRKEFFRVSLKEIREEIEKLGLTGINWTMTGQAKEYRETLATEKAIKDNPAARDAWMRRQLNLELTANEDLELVGALAEDE